MNTELTELGKGLLFFVGGIIFIFLGLFTSWLIRPHRPNPEKLTSYECGENTIGNAWNQFNIRFYVMGIIFLIFDVELILIFPWAYAFFDEEIVSTNPQWNFFSFLEIFFFIVILAAGWFYIWVHKDTDWIKPKPIPPKSLNIVPKELYEHFNHENRSHFTN